MHMEILYFIAVIAILLAQLISQLLLNRNVKKAFLKVEKYVNYIVEESDGTREHINIEETTPKAMDKRQKEILLQEMLEGFLT